MPGGSPASDSDVPPNPWFSWAYVTDHADQLRSALGDHVYLTVVPVTIALLIAFPMALIARRWRRLEGPLLAFAGALYTIPSLALFGALWPTFGLSRKTVVIDFQVEQEDTVYPMVPAGADLHKMIRRPSPIAETAAD